MAPPPPVNDEDYTGHISYFNYPFSPATDPNDPPILRIWAEIRPYLLSKGYEIPERIQNPFLGGIFYFAKPDHPIPVSDVGMCSSLRAEWGEKLPC